MAHAVEACVHCGFCLPTCPTYVVLQEEMDSPRGRIFLMKEVLEGNLGLEEALPYLDRCLACQACVTACPSGVPYGELIATFRLWSEEKRHRFPLERVFRLGLLRTLPYPERFRPLAKLGAGLKPLLRPLPLPKPLKAPLALLPDRLPEEAPYGEVYPAKGERRARVGLLLGCAQRVLRPSINQATIRVLQENGVEVVAVPEQACCGALNLHAGDKEGARALARKNLKAFRDVDYVVTNAAGCGSGMKEYPLLFRGARGGGGPGPRRQGEGLERPPGRAGLHPAPTPQAPLAGGLPRRLPPGPRPGGEGGPKKASPGGGPEVLEPREWELCCGSAGTYNLFQPEIAEALGRRKAENLKATGADLVATGNIGCLTQIQAYLDLPVLHTAELLALLYEGKDPLA